MSRRKKIGLIIGFAVVLIVMAVDDSSTSESTELVTSATAPAVPELVHGTDSAVSELTANETSLDEQLEKVSTEENLYSVINVVDGDTLDVLINGKEERLRLIGINTPETVDPRKPVECFGVEASARAKALLSGQSVRLEADQTQGERDKYGRLLRYVFLPDGTNFNEKMIADGYAFEYTYDTEYRYQTEFKAAESRGREAGAGLWGAACEPHSPATISPPEPPPATTNTSNDCTIKGNISSSGEKIYHMIGCASYNDTRIDESRGEAWFCTESEAVTAGWRKAKNCS